MILRRIPLTKLKFICKMNKSEFIEWLKNQENKDSLFGKFFINRYQNCDDFWELYTPGVDCVADSLDLRKEGLVIYSYDQPYGKEKKLPMTSS